MPNITVAVEDRLYRAARIYAAQYQTTLTEIMREFLTDIIPASCYMGDDYATSPVQERERRRRIVRERRLERGYPHPPPPYWDSVENCTAEDLQFQPSSNRIE